eukprot:2540675-Rhodomonas_salina.1
MESHSLGAEGRVGGTVEIFVVVGRDFGVLGSGFGEKLRRLMYLVIKELKPDSDCVIIVSPRLSGRLSLTSSQSFR